MGQSKKRQLRKAQERGLAKLRHHLETFGAAYARQTKILPDEAILRVDRVTDELGRPAGMKYWYEHFGPHVNDQTAHPHVQYLFDIGYAIVEANKKNDENAVKEGISALSDFMTMYDDTVHDPKEKLDVKNSEVHISESNNE